MLGVPFLGFPHSKAKLASERVPHNVQVEQPLGESDSGSNIDLNGGSLSDPTLDDIDIDNLVLNDNLISIFGFINSKKIFPAIKDYIKFALVIIGNSFTTEFMFSLTNVSQIQDHRRHFNLSKQDFYLINPNTRTCPVFRTSTDAELTKKIYYKVPVLVDEQTGRDPWGISFMTMFHMSNDSNLFYNEPRENLVPLYEAKMIYHYDHRFSTYENATEGSKCHLPPHAPALVDIDDLCSDPST